MMLDAIYFFACVNSTASFVCQGGFLSWRSGYIWRIGKLCNTRLVQNISDATLAGTGEQLATAFG